MLEHQSSKREIVGSNPAVGKKFFILYFSFSLCGQQLESANTNEINRHIHLAYTLF